MSELVEHDDGNVFVFCGHVERAVNDLRGCIRGAGHNGPHVFQQQHMPELLAPVVLKVGYHGTQSVSEASGSTRSEAP